MLHTKNFPTPEIQQQNFMISVNQSEDYTSVETGELLGSSSPSTNPVQRGQGVSRGDSQTTWSPEPEDISSISFFHDVFFNVSKPMLDQDFNLSSAITSSPFFKTKQNFTSFSETDFNLRSVLKQTSSLSHFVEFESNQSDSTTNTIKEKVLSKDLSTSPFNAEFSRTSEKFPYWTLGDEKDVDRVTAELLIKVLVLVLICAAGTVGNLMVIGTVVKVRSAVTFLKNRHWVHDSLAE